MSTILIGVEASEQSEDAIAFGARLAEVSTAHVVVACAFSFNDAIRQGSNPSYREALSKRAQETASAMRDRLVGIADDRTVIRITANPSPAHALQDLAEAEHAEMIVVGSSHTGRLGRVAPGSTGERLLHGAPCAVTIVPNGYRTETNHTIGRIGVAYDGSEEATAAVNGAVRLARAFSAELEVIGVVVPQLYAGAGMMGGAVSATPQDDLGLYVQQSLDDIVTTLPADMTIKTLRLAGNAEGKLSERSLELDLLIAGSRGYRPLRSVLLGGVTGRLVRTVGCPMIVIQRGAQAPLESLFSAATAAVV